MCVYEDMARDTEIGRLRGEVDTLREELKRKHVNDDDDNLHATEEEKEDQVEVHQCTECQKTYPLSTYASSYKKANKEGIIKKYVTHRRVCRKCRDHHKCKKPKTYLKEVLIFIFDSRVNKHIKCKYPL